MQKQQILEVIYKHMRSNIPGLGEQALEPNRSMKDYGAGSLDMVEVVSATMRELRVRVPRTQLAGLQDINGLAEVLLQAMQSAPR
jgi:acyl carrier protein